MKDDHPSFLTKRTIVGDNRLYLKFWAKLTRPFKNADFPVDIHS